MEGDDFKHVIRDSGQLVRQLDGLRVPDHAFMVEVDVSDFFMSGACDELVLSATSHFEPGPRRVLIRDSIRCLLESQMIESDLLPGRVFKVVQGSGMGLRHSGEITDASFYNLVEKGFIARPEVLQAFGIIHYSRYRDNLLILASNQALFVLPIPRDH